MLELGTGEAAYHAALADDLVKARIDLVFCAGPRMKHLWDALPESLRGAYAETSAELAPVVQAAVADGDVIMIKGSNGARMVRVVEALNGLDRSSTDMDRKDTARAL
jgi:UDP-N-acetylmuramoyl-tripeptide--D-alanyl-D-alanine ligase